MTAVRLIANTPTYVATVTWGTNHKNLSAAPGPFIVSTIRFVESRGAHNITVHAHPPITLVYKQEKRVVIALASVDDKDPRFFLS